MPLLFKSISHGEIPFGFFNIETDMILIDNYFFFASDMSNYISGIADFKVGGFNQQVWDIYLIEPHKIGNLMAAITGINLHGFIGEVYTHFPFPYEPEKFRQNPLGFQTRPLIESIVEKYGHRKKIEVSVDEKIWTITIGEYKFSREVFHELLRYLWDGGYPKWKDGIRPDYIINMKEKVENSNYPLFDGIKEILLRP